MVHLHFVDKELAKGLAHQSRIDPLTHEPFKLNDKIVFCKCCQSAFLLDSWEYMGKAHCNQQETLGDLPEGLSTSSNKDSRLLAILGWRYLQGQGRPKQVEMAQSLLLEAANLGDTNAMYNLGVIAENKFNYKEAIRWYLAAAKKGYPKAQCRLGILSWEGKGVQKNISYAIKCFTQAARNGCKESIRHMGWVYEKGLGVKQNLSKARTYYALAANSGDSEAEVWLRRLQAA